MICFCNIQYIQNKATPLYIESFQVVAKCDLPLNGFTESNELLNLLIVSSCNQIESSQIPVNLMQLLNLFNNSNQIESYEAVAK